MRNVRLCGSGHRDSASRLKYLFNESGPITLFSCSSRSFFTFCFSRSSAIMQPTIIYSAAFLGVASAWPFANPEPFQNTVHAFVTEGCYTDIAQVRAFQAKALYYNDLNLEKCVNTCRSYTVMGVENGREV